MKLVKHLVAAVVVSALFASIQSRAIADVTLQPDIAQPDVASPPDAKVVRQVQAGGAQIYTCRTDSVLGFSWTLIGPKALLINQDGSDFGTHSAGPAWTASDGSSIVADGVHPLAKIARPDSVPTLLLRVVAAHGDGILAPVRFVRRWDTRGGLPPDDGCDSEHAGAIIARHYSAIYTFYR